MNPRPNCDTWERDLHEPGECLLGSPSPGDDRRAWLREHPGEPLPAPGDEPAASDA